MKNSQEPLATTLNVKVNATFLGLTFLPQPFTLAYNNLHPKLVLSDAGIEYRAFFFTSHMGYDQIEKVEVATIFRSAHLCLIRKNSPVTVIANTSQNELFRCLKYLSQKGCTLTEKAQDFYNGFTKEGGY